MQCPGLRVQLSILAGNMEVNEISVDLPKGLFVSYPILRCVNAQEKEKTRTGAKYPLPLLNGPNKHWMPDPLEARGRKGSAGKGDRYNGNSGQSWILARTRHVGPSYCWNTKHGGSPRREQPRRRTGRRGWPGRRAGGWWPRGAAAAARWRRSRAGSASPINPPQNGWGQLTSQSLWGNHCPGQPLLHNCLVGCLRMMGGKKHRRLHAKHGHTEFRYTFGSIDQLRISRFWHFGETECPRNFFTLFRISRAQRFGGSN